MSTPSRRRSPAVYRRRRIVLLIAVLAVIAGVWLLVAQPWRGSAAEGAGEPTPAPTRALTALPAPTGETPAADAGATTTPPTPSSDAEVPTPEGTSPPAAAPCVASDIRVSALTDTDSYAPGQAPLLGIQLTNAGATDCSLNVGTTTQVFTVSSGDDVWWRSTDCQTEPSDMLVLLTAGQTVTSAAPVTWDRTRSSVGSCQDANRPRATGSGASYHLRVEIGGVVSTETKQFILY